MLNRMTKIVFSIFMLVWKRKKNINDNAYLLIVLTLNCIKIQLLKKAVTLTNCPKSRICNKTHK